MGVIETGNWKEDSAGQVLSALRQSPHEVAVFDATGGMLFASDLFLTNLKAAPGISEGQKFSLDDVLATEAPDLADEDRATFIEQRRALLARTNGYDMDVETGEGWQRRFRSASSTGATLLMSVSVDSLVRERQALAEAQDRLEHQAQHDPLTGLPNRRGLNAALRRLMTEDGKAPNFVAVLHVDLDKFKAVNDTLGHHAGDKVLSAAANVLRDNVRSEDIVARVGGDEFVLICSGFPSIEDIGSMAQRIVDKMKQPIPFSDEYCQIGASIGIATSASGATLSQLIKDADVALYDAKDAGRGRYRFFEPAMRTKYASQQSKLIAVNDALQLNAFEPYFRPILATSTGLPVALEVLPRWNHIERGILGPEAFVAAIREGNLARDLDQAIMRKTLKLMQNWLDEGVDLPELQVRLSVQSLSEPDVVDRLTAALDRIGAPRNRISVAYGEAQQPEATLRDNLLSDLEKAGIPAVMEGFGSGATSISGLRRLNVGRISVCRAVWDDISVDKHMRDVVSALTALARSQDIAMVAEDVETVSERSLLLSLGIYGVKGPLIGKPMPGSSVLPWLHGMRERRATGT